MIIVFNKSCILSHISQMLCYGIVLIRIPISDQIVSGSSHHWQRGCGCRWLGASQALLAGLVCHSRCAQHPGEGGMSRLCMGFRARNPAFWALTPLIFSMETFPFQVLLITFLIFSGGRTVLCDFGNYAVTNSKRRCEKGLVGDGWRYREGKDSGGNQGARTRAKLAYLSIFLVRMDLPFYFCLFLLDSVFKIKGGGRRILPLVFALPNKNPYCRVAIPIKQ